MTTPGAVPNDVRALIRGIERAFTEHMRKKDLRAMIRGFYADDAVLYAPGEPPVRGWDEIEQWYEGWINHVHEFDLVGERLESSGDLAYDTGTYHAKKSGAHDEGKFLAVFRRFADGGWRAVAYMYSSNHD